MIPAGGPDCDGCGACVRICPMHAIASEAPQNVLSDRCIGCMGCVAACPKGARDIPEEVRSGALPHMEQVCGGRKENRLYLPARQAAGSCPEGVSLKRIRDGGIGMEQAADWFSSKWRIPREAYIESMEACLKHSGADDQTGGSDCASAGDESGGVHVADDGGYQLVPQWYALVDASQNIIAGAGVIENDFHDRPDLAPNVCAVYTEEAWRCRGLAGYLLGEIRKDMAAMGVDTLYLITDHTSFYERYGWRFLTQVQGDGEETPTRMYAASLI